MDLNEFQTRAMSTCTASSANDAYMLLGLVGEVGELASKVAKGIRKENMRMSENNIFMRNGTREEQDEAMKNELGDVLWFIAGVAKTRGWTMQDVADIVLAKLKSRAERGVIVGDGDNR